MLAIAHNTVVDIHELPSAGAQAGVKRKWAICDTASEVEGSVEGEGVAEADVQPTGAGSTSFKRKRVIDDTRSEVEGSVEGEGGDDNNNRVENGQMALIEQEAVGVMCSRITSQVSMWGGFY